MDLLRVQSTIFIFIAHCKSRLHAKQEFVQGGIFLQGVLSKCSRFLCFFHLKVNAAAIVYIEDPHQL